MVVWVILICDEVFVFDWLRFFVWMFLFMVSVEVVIELCEINCWVVVFLEMVRCVRDVFELFGLLIFIFCILVIVCFESCKLVVKVFGFWCGCILWKM